MISWWWLLVGFAGTWLPMLGVAAWRDPDVRDSFMIVVYAVAAVPLLPLVWLLTRLDIGAIPLDPRALERFAGMRTVDHRPAWMFFTWKRGLIVLRKWEPGSHLLPIRVREPGE